VRGYASFIDKLKKWDAERQGRMKCTIQYLRNLKAFGLIEQIPGQLKALNGFYHFTGKELRQINQAVNAN